MSKCSLSWLPIYSSHFLVANLLPPSVNLVDMVSALLIIAIFIVFAAPGNYAVVLSIGAMEVLILFTVRSVVLGVR